MVKDYKKMLLTIKVRLEGESEERQILHDKLIEEKTITKRLMYELDLYKQKYGEDPTPMLVQPFAALN